MTSPATVASPELTSLLAAAAAAGLTVSSSACWPESDADVQVTPLAGFIESNFSPLVAEVAVRALDRRDQGEPPGTVIGIVLATALGDVTSASSVAAAVDPGQRVLPQLFFQSLPNAEAGYLAARRHLTGPVACVSTTAAALAAAALLIADADADAVLVVRADLAVTGGDGDRAAAVVLTCPAGSDGEGPNLRRGNR